LIELQDANRIKIVFKVLAFIGGHALAWLVEAGRSRVRIPIGSFHWHNPSGRTMVGGVDSSSCRNG